jgi:type I restriction-modification system DNA methylase subunit
MTRDELMEIFQNALANETKIQISDNQVSGKKDIFSQIYENLMGHKERKKYGQFFTHKELVDFIISNLPISPNSTILDPACGAGAFLSSANKKFGSEVELYGIDIDSQALKICELNLQHTCSEKNYTLFNLDTINQVSTDSFTTLSQGNGFDFIVGNPPFMNLKKNVDYDGKDPCYEGVISGVANSSTLFISKSLELL